MAEPLKPQDLRRLQLLVALQQHGAPMTGNELFAAVPEYRNGSETQRSDALEKLLERDREALAQDGFVVDVVVDESAPGDRSRWRYALSARNEQTVSLNAEEAFLVAVATGCWLDEGIAMDARRSYLKLLGMSQDGTRPSVSMPTLRLVTHPSFTPLRDAAATGHLVTFSYTNQDEHAPKQRRVVPLQLVQHRGRWLCNAWDLDRDAERNFVLSRIVSEVVQHPEVPEVPRARTDVPAMLDELAANNPAVLEVEASSRTAAELSRRAAEVNTVDGDRVQMHVYDWDHGLLADELAAFGTQVRVLSPLELRERVRIRMQRALTAQLAAIERQST